MALSLRETGETQLFEDQFLLNEEAKFFKNQTELLQQEKERLPLLDDEALAATVSLNSDLKTSVDINAIQQEQNEALQNEIEDLLREREQFKQFLMEMIAGWETRLSILDFCDENEVRENLEVFVATDKTQFNNLIYRQWIQSLRTWNGEPETLQRHLILWQSTFTFRGKACLRERFCPQLEEIEEEKEDGDLWECDEEESNLEEKVAEMYQSVESLHSESLKDSVDTSVLDSCGSSISGHDQETNSASGQVKKKKNFLKSWFKKTFKLKAKKAAVSQSSQQCRHHGEIQEEPKPSVRP
ncbi:uncharacterized protein [Takifugu rubripes]|uniref:uncharacterized protein n=1 Tax=Takifugu rubripes TaxID=31033 RepID=UPI001145AE34|nr:uncharacterized protein LOC115246775 [Takifugu rubripes]